ncbi:MAG: pilus assembly protein [Desulfovibrionaceae bacterium]|nr:pilus assembly protein [Desulfovibrionaceae bacterium]
MPRIVWVTALGLICLLMACAPREKSQGFLNAKGSFDTLGKKKPYRLVKDKPYLEAAKIEAYEDSLLKTNLTIRSTGSLPEICDLIMELVPVSINLVSENELAKGDLGVKSQPPAIASLLPNPVELPGDFPKRLNINHQGSLKKLLEQLAAQSGYGWDYDPKEGSITLARTMVKTYVLQAPPGRVSFNNQLTNKSRDNQTSTSLGNKINSTQTQSTTSAQIAQLYQGDLGFDVFSDTLNTVRTMLSPLGQAQGNQAAGTLTVRDRPENLRQIGRYISQVNARYAKQVAMKVNVYAVEINDESQVGFDLAAVIPNLKLGANHFKLTGGALSATQGTLGTATAAILDGHFQGTETMLTALKKVGRAKQITSAGIVALNNQPAPVEAIKKIAYLAGTSVETTDSGSETELTPGEVTTGFSMTITPHILGDRKVVLQYNVHLATLDALESFETNNTTIQLPQVSTRAFAQKATMLMGQTLVIAGFEQATNNDTKKAGLFSLSSQQEYAKSMIIVTIEVADANPAVL